MCQNAFKHFFVNTSSSENTFSDGGVKSPVGAKCNRMKACAIICLQEQLITRLFKFSEEVALKTLHRTFSQSCEQQTLCPFGPLPAGCVLRLQHSYTTSRGPQSHVMALRQMVTVSLHYQGILLLPVTFILKQVPTLESTQESGLH